MKHGETRFGWFHISDGHVHPCTIVATRYGGVYEGGRWAAFPCDPERLPDGWDGSDPECMETWHRLADEPVGRADTASGAHVDLLVRLLNGLKAGRFGAAAVVAAPAGDGPGRA